MNRELAQWVERVDGATEIREIAELLSEDARGVLLTIARRLLAGQAKYGMLDLKADTRNWREERRQEKLDELVYDFFEERQRDIRAKE